MSLTVKNVSWQWNSDSPLQCRVSIYYVTMGIFDSESLSKRLHITQQCISQRTGKIWIDHSKSLLKLNPCPRITPHLTSISSDVLETVPLLPKTSFFMVFTVNRAANVDWFQCPFKIHNHVWFVLFQCSRSDMGKTNNGPLWKNHNGEKIAKAVVEQRKP